MSNTQPTSDVLVPLSGAKKMSVTIGCILLLTAIMMIMSGNVLFLRPALAEMNQTHLFTLIVIVMTMLQAITNPIGGKLGDILGKRKLLLICVPLAIVFMILSAFSRNIVIFFISRALMSTFMGACVALPYVVAREINAVKDVPKFMGLLASGISLGTLLGGFVTGFFVDKNMIWMPMIVCAVVAALSALLIGIALPNRTAPNAGKLDVWGVLFMSVTIVCLMLGINMAGTASLGIVLLLFAGAVLGGFLLVKVEKQAAHPILPMHLMTNVKYVCMLLIGSIAYYYLAVTTVYAPIACTSILNGTNTQAGSLLIPRTIVVMVLPTFVGAWVGRKKGNIWKAIAISVLIFGMAMLPLDFINAKTPLMFLVAMLAVTGVAEAFRSVSITPGAQNMLLPEDMAIGTSLVTFMNTLVNAIATAFNGLIVDSAANLQTGIQHAFLCSAIVSFAGVLLTVLVIRRFFTDKPAKVPA